MTLLRTIKVSLFCCILVLISTRTEAQCGPFNCNDTINVSVNSLCMATITFDMLLKGNVGNNSNCTYDIVLKDNKGNLIAPVNGQAKLNPVHIGQFITAEISDRNNKNLKCWTIIRVEDKLPPGIICPGNDTLLCHLQDIGAIESNLITFLKAKVESKLITNCGNEKVEIRITKNVLTRNCVGPFAAIRVVNFIVVDKIFNQTECVDTFFYLTISLDDLSPPANFTDGNALKCYSLPRTDIAGLGTLPNYRGQPIAEIKDSSFTYKGLCNFKMTYSDSRFVSCGGSYKIVRSWTIIDWCVANKVKIFHQVIKVIDDRIVISSCPSNISDQTADPSDCKKSVTMPTPTVGSNECSNWSYTIFIKEPGATDFVQFGNPRPGGSSALSRRFAIGTTMVKYVVKDDCDNTDECMFNVTVVDKEPPVAVCDLRTVVTLNDSYFAKVYAKTFDNDSGDGLGPIDDGSYDHCSGPVSFKVRRVDGAKCGSSADFDDFVKFCCEDLGKVIMVELKVVDKVGLSSICMAEVVVQFKGPGPEFQCFSNPPDQDCRSFASFNINSLRPSSLPYSNPCVNAAIIPKADTITRSLDECGNGIIEVDWYVEYSGKKEIICKNKINFSNINAFGFNDIRWPADRTASGCNDLPPTASELSNLLPANIQCSKIVYSEPIDQVFENVPGTCRKILREWTVVDWCRYPANPSARWTYLQAIIVVNSEKPLFDSPAAKVEIKEEQANCRALVTAEAQATDDCSPSNKLLWNYSIDIVSGSQTTPLVNKTTGKTVTRHFDVGTYRINWFVKDECNNEATAFTTLNILDKQLPVVNCKNVIIEIDSVTRQATINAINLVANSSDNCDPLLQFSIRLARTENQLSNSLTFDCEQIGSKEIEVWAEDDAGNRAKCNSFIEIRDSRKICALGSSLVAVSGQIITSQNTAVETAEVELFNVKMNDKSMTTVEGKYAFSNIEMYQNYSIRASKNTDYLNGISTLDIILMQRHILGINKIADPYKLIAADLNESFSITASDIVILRKLILGQISVLPSNKSWKFVPKSYLFDDPLNPWNYKSDISLSSLQESKGSNDFIGVKMGDLDGNVQANSAISKSRSSRHYNFTVTETQELGHVIHRYYATSEFSTHGFQLDLDLNEPGISFKEIQGQAIYIDPSMIEADDDRLKFSWNTIAPTLMESGKELFSIVYEKSNRTNRADKAIKSSSRLTNEIYNAQLETYTLNLDFIEHVNEELIVYQNKPNPFEDYTNIEFELSEAQQINFRLIDLRGQKVFEINNLFVKGKNQIRLGKHQLGLNKGIYYYQINSQNRSLTKKMIIF